MSNGHARGEMLCQRIVRVYDTAKIHGQTIPTIYIIKPDQVRYWTRSMGLRDADEVAGDIMSWKKPIIPVARPFTGHVNVVSLDKEEAAWQGEEQS